MDIAIQKLTFYFIKDLRPCRPSGLRGLAFDGADIACERFARRCQRSVSARSGICKAGSL